MNPARPPSAPLRAIDAASSDWGRPWASCQSPYGSAPRIASAAPATSQRERSSPRGPRIASARRTTAITAPIRDLFSSAIPRTAPAGSHQRSSPVRSTRAISSETTAVAHTSYVVVVRKCPVTRHTAPAAQQPPASVCARRSPPSSRASRPVVTVVTPQARIAGARSTSSEPGASRSIARASSGASSGWSGYPKRRMSAGGDEVQLVAVIAVAAAGQRQRQHCHPGDREQRPTGNGRECTAPAPPRRGGPAVRRRSLAVQRDCLAIGHAAGSCGEAGGGGHQCGQRKAHVLDPCSHLSSGRPRIEPIPSTSSRA